VRRTLLVGTLAVVGVLALAGTASADIGDIDTFTIDDDPQGTATDAEVSGTISCTTSIEYGLVGKVSQEEFGTDPAQTEGSPSNGSGATTNNQDVEGVGAFGPNQGNEANSPCSTSVQGWEIVIQNNRDSGPYEDNEWTGQLVFAGTSAVNGTRGPGPFIGDLEYGWRDAQYERTDP
jgi:hypothetical protein